MSREQGDRAPATEVRLSDYRPLPWRAATIDLEVDLHETHAEITAVMAWVRNPVAASGDTTLALHGEALQTDALEFCLPDGAWQPMAAAIEGGVLRWIPPAGAGAFSTRVVTTIRPQDNRTMEGLYRSGGMFCTQMEAEGFRRVTWSADRPDVLSVWTVRIEADAGKYPVLLSNGNLVEARATEGGRHMTAWHDPFPKPTYLFALIAGDLDVVDGSFRTCSGKDVRLRILTDRGNADQAHHALACLQRAMRWDEDVYGREYDLDIFHIVAVHDFNMGAMENKSLNIFNASAVLARSDTATDDRHARIDAIVAHEYFHNWSGNRVTCRDWFQLSLKEGFTVYRDQEYSAEVGDRGVARIQQVRHLRQTQFAEDAGPMAHPVRPDRYVEINNFYTTTIYEKGAELIRMMATIVGPAGFRAGTDLYFARHDGQAVTCDDFVAALEDATGVSLQAFKRWYTQAGTPLLTARGSFDEAAGTYTLQLAQQTPATPGQPTKDPVVIPVRLGLLGRDGSPLPLAMSAIEARDAPTERVVVLDAVEASFTFFHLDAPPVPALLRGFSAPVRLDDGLDDAALRHLVRYEPDPFVRWDALQRLASAEILAVADRLAAGRAPAVCSDFLASFAALLADRAAAPAFLAEAGRLPDEAMLAELVPESDAEALFQARQAVRKALAMALHAEWVAVYERHAAATSGRAYSCAPADAGHRAWKNVALSYLAAAGEQDRAFSQLLAADNMSDELAALAILADADHPRRQPALERFASRWSHDALVMNMWFSVQASAAKAGVAADVRRLAQHPLFDAGNPNKVRALFGAFSLNPRHFHAADGSGYALLAERIAAIDPDNPILAGRLARAFNPWRRQTAGRREVARQVLEGLAAIPSLSPNTREVVDKLIA